MQNYKYSKIWNETYSLLLDIYALLDEFPDANLADRMAKTSTSFLMEITKIIRNKELRDESISLITELEILLLISKDLSYIDKDVFQVLTKNIDLIRLLLYKTENISKKIRDRITCV